MTAIVAIKDTHGVHLATDSYAAGMYNKDYNTKKFFKLGDRYIAFAGDIAIQIPLIKSLAFTNQDIYVQLLELKISLKSFYKEHEGFNFVVTNGDVIIEMNQETFGDTEIAGGAWGGCGGHIAYTAYKTLRKHTQLSKEECLKKSIEQAIEMNDGCGGTVDYIFIPKPSL